MENDPFQKDFDEPTLCGLYRRMQKTSKARFNAAVRLRRHQRYSLWSLSFASAGLIIFRVLAISHMHGRIPELVFNLIEVGLAVLVLLLSVLLSVNDFGDNAEKMHRCAVALNCLSLEILPACTEEKNHELFAPTLQKYCTILDSYPNHENIDFALVRLDLQPFYQLSFGKRCQIHLVYWLPYLGYLILVALVLVVIVIAITQHLAIGSAELKEVI